MNLLPRLLIVTTFLLQFGVTNSDILEVRSIDELIQSALQKSGTPGAALVIVRGGKIIHARGYGYADPESRFSATSETIWPIASITKVLTAIGIMQLVESGKVSLNADVNKYFSSVKVPNTFEMPITVADLLRHTSGLDELINKDGTLNLWGSRWIPIGQDLFSRDDGRARLAFVRDAKGKVVALSGGSWRVGERIN